MGKRGSRAAKVHRQGIVRSLMARGMEQYEILEMLSTNPKYCEEYVYKDGEMMPNPHFCGNVKTGEPVDKSTISRDWKEIHEQWRTESLEDVSEHFARQQAQIRELYRIAQLANDRKECRELVKLEMQLLGTARPAKMEHRWDDEQLGKVDKLKHLFQEMRQREVDNGHSDD